MVPIAPISALSALIMVAISEGPIIIRPYHDLNEANE
jgi:hypothetical protein